MRNLPVFVCLWAAAAVADAQPVIAKEGVRNAASARHGLFTSAVAQGSIVVIAGEKLGPASRVEASSKSLPTELSGTSVRISSGGLTLDAPLLYVSASEVAAIVPSVTPTGLATLVVTRDSAASHPAALQIVGSDFAAFTLNRQSEGAGVFVRFRSQASLKVNELDGYVQPGQELTLWGTGLGAVNGSDAEIPAAGDVAASVSVLVDDKPAQVIYKGRADCCQGLDRIVFQLPESTIGCNVPVAVRTGDTVNLVSLLSVSSDDQFCPTETGFSPADLEKARAQGGLKIGTMYLMRYGDAASGQNVDMGFAGFSRVSYERMRQFRPTLEYSIPGACYAWTLTSDGVSSQTPNVASYPGNHFFGGIYPFGEEPLDAGSALTLSGPGGQQRMNSAAPGFYSWMYADGLAAGQSYLRPGTYSLENGSGGRDVGAFRANLEIPAPITWTNTSGMAKVPRSRDLTLTWTGGGRSDRIWILASSMSISADYTQFAMGFVSCSEQANRGKLTIPASHLTYLPVSQGMEGLPLGSLVLYSSSVSNRLDISGGLDAAYVVSIGYQGLSMSFE